MRSPRAFSSRILCTTVQCTPGAVWRQKRPYASMSIGRPMTARRLLDHAFEVGRDVELALLEQVPVGLVLDFAFGFGRVGIGGDRVGDRAPFDADVRRVAEEQPQQRTLRVALGFLERADADEQRARDHAAEIEDDRADRHGGK